MVEFQFSKLATRVRFPSPAPHLPVGVFSFPLASLHSAVQGISHYLEDGPVPDRLRLAQAKLRVKP